MADDNVVRLKLGTTLDVPVERVLERALKEGLDRVLVIGRDGAGDLFIASSTGDCALMLWDLEHVRARLLDPP